MTPAGCALYHVPGLMKKFDKERVLLAVAGPVWFGPGLAAWLAIVAWAAWWAMALVAGVGALR